MDSILDHIKKDLKILFVGFNPSIRSGESGHHYANPNNRFWKILYQSGLTDQIYRTYEDYKLLEIGYGFTNIVSRPTKAADEITKDEYQAGREELMRKIRQYKPKIVCFVGKGVYQEYSKRKVVSWGFQDQSIVPGVTDFVAPSSSGLVRMKLDEIVAIYSLLTAANKTK
ncbi:TDG/mug DNA glycosylase family protein [Peribacillus deserti]|uniref:TDG/mug DNA glycosylase family protein n=1 Tax=Peribacillus deserti TaxID=673318 RepID=A0ABS2QDK5_9BACI|nr:mismatch-specific DNA-glycosylase [Peribacillus deserti]MBM7691233.1 TDG/mug DNA glycosylase family protein [Peribacillus deserti]